MIRIIIKQMRLQIQKAKMGFLQTVARLISDKE